MIKIAIVTRKMIMGGVEKTLINLLNEFDNRHVEIDLYVQELGGELEDRLPGWVHKCEMPRISWKEYFSNLSMLVRKIFTLYKLNCKKIPYIEQCCLSTTMYKSIDKEYDIAISYHAPNTVPVFYTIDKIKAKKKILWLHGDLKSNSGTTDIAGEYYRKYDKIFTVSEFIRQEFVNIFPEKKNQTEVFYNFFYPEEIIKKSSEAKTYEDEYKGIRILSIGRISQQKGYDIAVNVCERLIKDGFEFKWYICGDGEEKKNIESQICEKGLTDYMILLGNQSNPYGYLRDCDLYVQTSRFEGYCTTTNEAKALKKPVITTNVSGAHAQFIQNVTGWIIDINEDAIYQKIKEVLSNIDICQTIVKNIEKDKNGLKSDIQTVLDVASEG